MTLGKVMILLSTTPKTQSMKEVIDNLDIIKIKNFCSEDDTAKT